MFREKEENIENEILCFFLEKWILAWKNDIKWFFDVKRWIYRKNKSNFIRKWISDITVIINWKPIFIEVKKPSEMSFFDRDLKDLQERYVMASLKNSNLSKYLHAIEQKEFLVDIEKSWWIWFFACSLNQVKEKLKEFKILL